MSNIILTEPEILDGVEARAQLGQEYIRRLLVKSFLIDRKYFLCRSVTLFNHCQWIGQILSGDVNYDQPCAQCFQLLETLMAEDGQLLPRTRYGVSEAIARIVCMTDLTAHYSLYKRLQLCYCSLLEDSSAWELKHLIMPEHNLRLTCDCFRARILLKIFRARLLKKLKSTFNAMYMDLFDFVEAKYHLHGHDVINLLSGAIAEYLYEPYMILGIDQLRGIHHEIDFRLVHFPCCVQIDVQSSIL